MTPEELLCAAPQPVGATAELRGAPSAVGVPGRGRSSACWPSSSPASPSSCAVAATPAATADRHGFAPYVDVTATPTYAFEDVGESGPTDAILAFVVSSKTERLRPELGRRLLAGRGRRAARPRPPGGAARPARSTRHGLLRRGRELRARHRLHRRGRPGRRLPVGGGPLLDRHDRPRHRGRGSLGARPWCSGGPGRSRPWSPAERAAGRHLDVWLTLPVSTTGLTPEGARRSCGRPSRPGWTRPASTRW